MYCVKCGVELGKTERKCPLCMTPVYYTEPDGEVEPLYPEYVNPKEEFNPKGVYFIASFLFVIAAVISGICDLSLNFDFTWSGYVIGGLLLGYVILILPKWFRRASPAIFVPVNFVAIGLFLLYISIETGGGWFLSFAFPILGAIALIVSAVAILSYYLRCGYLYIYGGASIAVGALSVLIEILIHLNFSISHDILLWSLYPLCSFFLIGMMLIIIAIVPPFKESLRKIFVL